jgi:ATP-dependent DNA helicase RecQ
MAGRFEPPPGEILAVRVAAVLVRTPKNEEGLRCDRWELVLPEIEFAPGAG